MVTNAVCSVATQFMLTCYIHAWRRATARCWNVMCSSGTSDSTNSRVNIVCIANYCISHPSLRTYPHIHSTLFNTREVCLLSKLIPIVAYCIRGDDIYVCLNDGHYDIGIMCSPLQYYRYGNRRAFLVIILTVIFN